MRAMSTMSLQSRRCACPRSSSRTDRPGSPAGWEALPSCPLRSPPPRRSAPASCTPTARRSAARCAARASTMRATELSLFESAIQDVHVGGIMCAFPLINGIFTCQDPSLLTNVLRDQFGFRGYVRSDNPAPITSDVEAVNAGLDQAVAPHLD